MTIQGRTNQLSLKLRCIAGGGQGGVIAVIVPTVTILAGIRATRGNCAPVRGDGGTKRIVKAARDDRRLPGSPKIGQLGASCSGLAPSWCDVPCELSRPNLNPAASAPLESGAVFSTTQFELVQRAPRHAPGAPRHDAAPTQFCGCERVRAPGDDQR